ncbi:MAG TPA: 23S rRNA (adenine(2503)-C(2))-methyltransferase RlmN [Gammaproteobacteria bacterium]|nr:23S rRNA (adenine(2503)-C(2))-methyltransferase RlmN [Gammaproteobacteria bacterium]HAR89421.1 23S rRNA (adenine(2503)-C(2))-methyltransferase RlmN [Gammaproteobacteria bacterium]HAU25656.1 23S rRNA (adenine(2503)-C(2))-methyltransferase RlmN [Gammaproteobacteria bacterium]HBJ89275.1 23S rRNA (adenine(2503)-C(2))-methyltransferase RlmN [Gammaproteobacteria bacterium]|tara:strand:- start:109 stop:1296 length:1188 start_codon:yes stop_codon:yes gene_type:complete
MAEERPNLLGLSRDKMKALFSELGEKPFRAQQIMQWLHQRGELELNAMTDISKSLRGQLEQSVDIRLPKIVADYPSDDGSHKWVIEVASGSRVEMVFIPEGGRGTLCVSSQAGCSLDCSFCATGKQGFNSNLTVAEIVGQVWLARQQLGGFEQGAERKVSNVVMMGMGEPLLNFEAVMDAVNIMMDDWAYGLSKRKVTISTSGVVPAIRRMKEFTDASLAVSLHAPNDALRSSIMPINKRYPIGELLDAVTDYMAGLQDKRMPVIEYTLIKGINDHRQHARELAQVLASFPCKINLIPFNPFSLSDYQRPSDSVIGNFREILQRAGFTVTVRTTRADDIGAACGQLVGDVEDQTRRQQRHLKRAQQGGVNANSEKERRTEILASTANLATTADRF